MKLNNLNLTSRKELVLPLACIALFIPVIVIEYHVIQYTSGLFMYPIDDTFIHLTVAKNLALHGTWGISKNEFQSASSSILYTLILAGLFRLFSVHVVIPFVINVIAGAGLLIVVKRWLQKENVQPFAQLLTLLAVIFFTPLPILIISGMEHTLQCLFSFLFIFNFSDWLSKNEKGKPGKWKLPWSLIIYGILVCSIRYEGLFLVIIACLILLYKRKPGVAFLLGIISFLPILLFGIYFITEGSYFLPNSVLLKSGGLSISPAAIIQFIKEMVLTKLTLSPMGVSSVATQRLLAILPLAYLFFAKQIRQTSNYRYILILLMACSLLQITLASTGWFFRYEAYLILCTVVILSVFIDKYSAELGVGVKQHPVIGSLLLFVLLLPFFIRASLGFQKASQSCINIYDQQYQMAKFLHRYYDHDNIAANDIGAISYLKDAKVIDLWGLANIKITRSKRNNYYTPRFVDSLSKSENAKIAIIYDKLFSDSLLNRWDKVATWCIPNDVICLDSVVCFYAIDTSEEKGLRKNLKDYQSALPRDIRVKYYSSVNYPPVKYISSFK